ncbi:hypothetical protein F5883DRAFT_422569 [Diaporthe sp. PMI_573]|nr:hypothetical protein F5883DRAFT_422569 [Diaporthaceae sp. PMI_573]
MENLYIYLITIGVALALLLLIYLLYVNLHPCRCFFLQHLILPLLLKSSKWVRVTRLEALMILLYLSLNVVFLSLGANTLQDLAATMALINLVPAFLGQWTNPLAEFLGISRRSYYLIHRWTGRIAIFHSFIHTFFILRQYRNFTTDKLISGCAVTYRLIRVAFFSSRAVVKSAQRTGDVVQVKLRTLKPVSIAPGSYFHVFLPVSRFSKDHLQLTKYNFLQSYPLAAYWDSKEDISGRSDPVLLIHTGKLPRFEQIKENQTLLLDGPYQQGLAIENYDIVILTAEGRGILRILPIMINLMARRLSDKKGPDKSLFRDRTRRVDLFWWLGDNAEDKWVREQLRSLKSLDPEHKFLLVWVLYPKPKSDKSEPLFPKSNNSEDAEDSEDTEEEKYWVCAHDCAGLNKEHIIENFREAVTLEARAPGRRTVVSK